MLVLVAYDITDPRRLYRTARLLRRYGHRVQQSVFECHLDARTVPRLVVELEGLIDARVDRVAIYRLCAKDVGGCLLRGAAVQTRDWSHVVT